MQCFCNELDIIWLICCACADIFVPSRLLIVSQNLEMSFADFEKFESTCHKKFDDVKVSF